MREAFAAGMQWAFRLVAVLAFVGLVISVLFVGGSLLRSRGRGHDGRHRRPCYRNGAVRATAPR